MATKIVLATPLCRDDDPQFESKEEQHGKRPGREDHNLNLIIRFICSQVVHSQNLMGISLQRIKMREQYA